MEKVSNFLSLLLSRGNRSIKGMTIKSAENLYETPYNEMKENTLFQWIVLKDISKTVRTNGTYKNKTNH